MADFPLYQPEFGFKLPRTHMAAVDISYYTLVKLGKADGSQKDKYISPAGAGDVPVGIVIPEVGRDMMIVSDPNGYGDGFMPRTGYKAGQDYPQIHVFGVAWVKLAAGVTATAGQYAKAGVGGLTAVFVDGTDDEKLKAGLFIDSGNAGQYVRVFFRPGGL